MANKIANSLRTVIGERIIKLVEYDLSSDSIVVSLDWDKINMYDALLDLFLVN